MRPAARLGERIAGLRPELDLYLVTQVSAEEIASQLSGRFRRVFHHEDVLELHLSILHGVQARYQTPFFSALRDYSRQPTGVFHAKPGRPPTARSIARLVVRLAKEKRYGDTAGSMAN